MQGNLHSQLQHIQFHVLEYFQTKFSRLGINIHCILGAFVPLTMEGNIVADGVLSSCYASFDHGLAHFALTSMQWFPDVLRWVFGEENGSSGYVEIAKGFARLMLPFSHLYQRSNF